MDTDKSSFHLLNQHGSSRTHYPIRFAYAFTIHKSQGQTLEKVDIDI